MPSCTNISHKVKVAKNVFFGIKTIYLSKEVLDRSMILLYLVLIKVLMPKKNILSHLNFVRNVCDLCLLLGIILQFSIQ